MMKIWGAKDLQKTIFLLILKIRRNYWNLKLLNQMNMFIILLMNSQLERAIEYIKLKKQSLKTNKLEEKCIKKII